MASLLKTERLRWYVGKRVLLLGKHPHKGNVGVAVRTERTSSGDVGLIVNLDRGVSCFVFEPREVREVE